MERTIKDKIEVKQINNCTRNSEEVADAAVADGESEIKKNKFNKIMKLELHIHNIKSISDLTINLPTNQGLYAITGQNGSGKSTIATCASRAFFNMRMEDYFGETAAGAFIECKLNGIFRKWYKELGKRDWQHSSNGRMEIKGFYEGSLIFGNRFRNTSYEKLRKTESVEEKSLNVADDFIRSNLGNILQGDPQFYEKMWYVYGNVVGLNGGYVFYYEKKGKRVSQFHMSTGENLLISILNSLYIRNNDRGGTEKPCMVFLDEIELALHPSSLKRLLVFLGQMSKQYNYAIYFSTHSIELISAIKPTNIFYLERFADDTLQVVNPCYPAYATKFLYDQSGYDNVILVEDDLAKCIVDRIVRKEKLLTSRLVHILPCGGWTNVLSLAYESSKNYLLGKRTSLSVVLDKDIMDTAQQFITDNKLFNLSVNYLPVKSLEKYLRSSLVFNIDSKLFKLLSDYVFQQTSLHDLVQCYKTTKEFDYSTDNSGKNFYALIEKELSKHGKDRKELIEVIVEYLMENPDNNMVELIKFLKNQFS